MRLKEYLDGPTDAATNLKFTPGAGDVDLQECISRVCRNVFDACAATSECEETVLV